MRMVRVKAKVARKSLGPKGPCGFESHLGHKKVLKTIDF